MEELNDKEGKLKEFRRKNKGLFIFSLFTYTLTLTANIIAVFHNVTGSSNGKYLTMFNSVMLLVMILQIKKLIKNIRKYLAMIKKENAMVMVNFHLIK